MSLLKRLFYISLGFVCTTLGIIGIWVPGMPTTVFILIALWAFSRSSNRLHKWLTKIPILKQTIREVQRFEREKTIDARVKIVSQSCAWISFVAVTLITRSIALAIILGLLALSCSVFMNLVPTSVKQPAPDRQRHDS